MSRCTSSHVNEPSSSATACGGGIKPAVCNNAVAIQTQKAPEDPRPTHAGNLNLTVTLTANKSLKIIHNSMLIIQY